VDNTRQVDARRHSDLKGPPALLVLLATAQVSRESEIHFCKEVSLSVCGLL
jgi:hypothetical protein